VIREALTRIVRHRATTDPNPHHLDGLDLHGETDQAELPLPDDLHPDPAAHRRIGERFADFAFGGGGPFDAARRASTDGCPVRIRPPSSHRASSYPAPLFLEHVDGRRSVPYRERRTVIGR